MKTACTAPLLLLALIAMPLRVSAENDSLDLQSNPIQKVIQLMEGMIAKGKAGMEAEQTQFATYKQFCQDTSKEKTDAIADAEDQIELLKASIQKSIATAAKLTEEIAAHEEDISVWKGDEVAATKVRDIEKIAYKALHKDYSESVDALTRAIAVLKKQAYDRKQAKESLVQVATLQKISLIPTEAKRAINQYLALGQQSEGLAAGAPEANAYEFQSQSIIDVLEKLLDKFIDERTDAEKKEMNSANAFHVLMQDLANDIAFAEKTLSDKKSQKAAALQAKADAEGDLTDTTTTMQADIKYKSDLVATCEMKAGQFESRQGLRAEEIEAIKKAIEIISSENVKGYGEKYLPSMLQKKQSALAQLRAAMPDNVQERVAAYLSAQSKQLNSRVLSTLAVRVKADPLGKVKKMIKDLIVKLMEEATEEAEHKGWCDTELSTNEQTRQEKTESVETLTAEIDELKASVSKLTDDVATLTSEVAELDKAMAEATTIRQAEKAKNKVTIEEAKEAQTAVAQALTVLNEFYAKAAEATALLQRHGSRQTPPPIWEEAYTGMQGENGGVIGMLQVIESDFARLEADTESDEASSAKEYATFMEDSKVDKASKESSIEAKTTKKQDQSGALTTKSKDLEGTQKELTAALAYYDKLKPSCVDAGVVYDDRVARRKEEIESLQEALRILNGEDIR